VKFLKNVVTLGHEVYKDQDVHIIQKLKIDARLGTCIHVMLDENIIATQSSLCT
jgi:hypothetical protein